MIERNSKGEQNRVRSTAYVIKNRCYAHHATNKQKRKREKRGKRKTSNRRKNRRAIKKKTCGKESQRKREFRRGCLCCGCALRVRVRVSLDVGVAKHIIKNRKNKKEGTIEHEEIMREREMILATAKKEYIRGRQKENHVLLQSRPPSLE